MWPNSSKNIDRSLVTFFSFEFVQGHCEVIWLLSEVAKNNIAWTWPNSKEGNPSNSLDKNVSVKYFGLIQPGTSFYGLFGSFFYKNISFKVNLLRGAAKK